MPGTPSPATPTRKAAKPLGWMTVVYVLVGVLVVCALGWFQSDIRSILKARAWDSKTPTAVAERFANAVKQGDRAAIEQLSPKIALEEEGGKIVKIKPAGAAPQMAPYAFDAVQAKIPLQIIEKRFDFRGPAFVVTVSGENARSVQYVLSRDTGTWTVHNLVVIGR